MIFKFVNTVLLAVATIASTMLLLALKGGYKRSAAPRNVLQLCSKIAILL